jgi:hypothetical protein
MHVAPRRRRAGSAIAADHRIAHLCPPAQRRPQKHRRRARAARGNSTVLDMKKISIDSSVSSFAGYTD